MPKKGQRRRGRGRPKKDGENKRGGPSDAARDAIGDIQVAKAVDFFNLIISSGFQESHFVDSTNTRASCEGAGAKAYKDDWHPFENDEMDKFIGLLFANGLYPRPSVGMWFKSTDDSHIFGNDKFARVFDKITTEGRCIYG